MMKYFSLLSCLVFSGFAYSSDKFECYALENGDKCIKYTEEEFDVIDPSSNEFWNSMISYAGKTLWDSLQGGAESQGKVLATSAVMVVAQSMGVPSAVLSMVGFPSGESDVSNSVLLAEIDRLIKEQTQTLLSEMDNNKSEIISAVFGRLQDQCLDEIEADYLSSIRALSLWNNYNVETKGRVEQLSSLLYALYRLDNVRQKYSTGDFSEGSENCFWGLNVEFFSWVMSLYSIEMNTRTSYHFLASNSNDLANHNLFLDFQNIKYQVDDILKFLSVSRISDDYLSRDEDVSPLDDKANVWWDDVRIDFTDLELKIDKGKDFAWVIDNCNSINVSNKSMIFRMLSEADPYYGKADKYPGDKKTFRKCLASTYSYSGVEFHTYVYLMLHNLCNAPVALCEILDAPAVYTGMVVSEYFYEGIDPVLEDADGDFLSVSNALYLMTAREGGAVKSIVITDDLVSIVEDRSSLMYRIHMDMEYAQRLQMAYFPYQEFLNGIWSNVGESRLSNKLDRELERTSGLYLLDVDGLDIATELIIGSDPRDGDTDDDGIPDGWEYNHGSNPLVSDENSDSDGDGISNYEEYSMSL